MRLRIIFEYQAISSVIPAGVASEITDEMMFFPESDRKISFQGRGGVIKLRSEIALCPISSVKALSERPREVRYNEKILI